MANSMAILQEIDKCIKCGGCYIACKRTWNMAAKDFGTKGLHKIGAHQRVVIKSQNRIDMGPFVRYSCWHCQNPPCAGRCPFKAIKKETTGGVSVDMAKCNPSDPKCLKQCVTDCQRGGYPRIGTGNYAGDLKMYKCTMCHGRAGSLPAPDGSLPDLPTKTVPVSGEYRSSIPSAPDSGNIPELAHWPMCVYTCPAKAMTYDTRNNIRQKLLSMKAAALAAGKPFAAAGDGGMFWVTTKATAIVPPKADPFVEDHVTPMVSGILASPIAKAAVVPTLVVGGLLALSARRAENEKDLEVAMDGEV